MNIGWSGVLIKHPDHPFLILQPGFKRRVTLTHPTLLKECVDHYHEERSHQGVGNVIPFPGERNNPGSAQGEIVCRERLGGLLKFYYQKAS